MSLNIGVIILAENNLASATVHHKSHNERPGSNTGLHSEGLVTTA